MIYTENQHLPRWTAALFAALAVWLYVLPIGLLPVRSREARLIFAAHVETRTADDQDKHLGLPGRAPYALASRLTYRLLAPPATLGTEIGATDWSNALPALHPRRALWSVRLPGLLGLLLLTLPCLHIVRSEAGRREAMVAGGIILTSWPLLWATAVDSRAVLLAGLLNAAWFMWYHYGRFHRNWDRAWAAAALFLLPVCLEDGLPTFGLFYLPLIFLRRPFRIWQRMLNPVHLFMLGGILIVGIFWGRLGYSGETVETIRQLYADGFFTSTLLRWSAFPLLFALAFLPWPTVVWPAFCVAYRPLERSPQLMHFLRTLVVPLFCCIWLLPDFPRLLMAAVTPPLAALAAIHYTLLVRRHIAILRAFLGGLWGLTALLALATVTALLLHVCQLVEMEGVRRTTVAVAAAYGTVSCLLLLLARSSAIGRHFWLHTLVTTAAGMSLLGCLFLPANELFRRQPAAEAAKLVENVPGDAVVYLLYRGNAAAVALFSERTVVPIQNTAQLPANQPIVYVLGSGRVPILETRRWERLGNPVFGDHPTVQLQPRGNKQFGWILKRVYPDTDERELFLRMYRGLLDEPSRTPPA